MQKNDLIKTAQLIQKNIEMYGWKRYDLRDTRWIPFLLKKNIVIQYTRKLILLMEEFFPILIRKILKVKKKLWATTYSFIGNAYLLAEKRNIDFGQKMKSTDIADMCLKEYLIDEKDVNTWWGDNPHIGFGGTATKETLDKRPTILMHALTRCNIFLLNVGKQYNLNEYIDIAYRSAVMVMKQYEIIDFGDGSKSISYFYNSRDCTININSEFAHWISMIPEEKIDQEMKDMFFGMLNLILKEQNEDGSWFYFSKWHMKEYSEKPSCDCHHTATVLFNLLNITKCSYLTEENKEKIIKSINKGVSFFISNFFQENGKGKTEIGKKREAGPVQYSESIYALCEFIKNEKVDDKIKKEVKALLPNILQQNLNLINKRNGSAPSEKIIKWKKLNSIRWGNGPILQSIMSYLEIENEIEEMS